MGKRKWVIIFNIFIVFLSLSKSAFSAYTHNEEFEGPAEEIPTNWYGFSATIQYGPVAGEYQSVSGTALIKLSSHEAFSGVRHIDYVYMTEQAPIEVEIKTDFINYYNTWFCVVDDSINGPPLVYVPLIQGIHKYIIPAKKNYPCTCLWPIKFMIFFEEGAPGDCAIVDYIRMRHLTPEWAMTATPTATVTEISGMQTPIVTPTTFTGTSTNTMSPTATSTISPTMISTPMLTRTPTFSNTPTFTPTITRTITPSCTLAAIGTPDGPPILEPIGDKAISWGRELRFYVEGHEPDWDHLGDDAITVQSLPNGAVLEPLIRYQVFPNPFIGMEFIWVPTREQIGNHVLTFTVTGMDGLSDSKTMVISVGAENRTPTMTVTPFVEATQVTAYPNPARGKVNFAYTLEGSGKVQIDIYKLTGERVASIAENVNGGAGQTLSTAWEAADVAPGIYFCRIVITDNNGKVVLDQKKKVALIE